MIYLDFAAATPVSEKALEAMKPFFAEEFFNPSAAYLPAKRVREKYEQAKADIAHLIGAKGADLVMTAGATESINLAFTAVDGGKVLVLATEHDAVKNVAREFEYEEIKVDRGGVIDLEDLREKLTGEVTMVSVALASGELGVIQPLAKIAEMVKAERRRRLLAGSGRPLYLHSDASQALSLIDFNVARLGVDLLTLNAAKVYGPKGVGALYVGHEVALAPILRGGGQEMGLRSGTENVAGVVGFAAAAREAKEHLTANRKKYARLKEILMLELGKCGREVLFLGNGKRQLANFCPISIPGVDAERLIYLLEEQGIYVSTGAACAASKGKKSETLGAIGLDDSEIAGSLRITMGALNSEEQIRRAAKKIAELIDKTEIKKVEKKTVFVGMSGGVDSSVAALLLKEQGYHVVGVYMKNWSRDLPGMKCPWAEDLADAKRVATKLGIEFKVFDFEKEYKQKVVDYMLEEFAKGRTPNPDIMCNQEIKFKLFYDVAREQGADFIATGHYARNGLLRARDENKDQTYFLYRMSQEAIEHTIFPIGEMLKPEVKKLAAEAGLDNAYKKESMGVCFVGEVGIKDFLKQYVESRPGDIIDADSGEKIGVHEGAIFYTIGQRKGLDIGGGLPYYVVSKDMQKNIVYVSRNLNNSELWTKEIELQDIIMRDGEVKVVRMRHRGELVPAKLEGEAVVFEKAVRRPASGQSVVFYGGEDNQVCLGGGIVK